MPYASFHEMNQADLDTVEVPAGGFILTRDAGNLYIVDTEGNRVKIQPDIIMIPTEAEREAMLAPIPYKLYAILETGMLYSYTTDWLQLAGKEHPIPITVPEYEIDTPYADANITADRVGTFVPDASIADLVTDIAVVCAEGTATVTCTSDYPVFGTLIII